jgi:hypothetical protein
MRLMNRPPLWLPPISLGRAWDEPKIIARIGYTSPPLLTEVFAYDFYRLAPAGVTLVLTTLAILDRNKDEVDRCNNIGVPSVAAPFRMGGKLG